jgi:class 3 adenylate cyclase
VDQGQFANELRRLTSAEAWHPFPAYGDTQARQPGRSGRFGYCSSVPPKLREGNKWVENVPFWKNVQSMPSVRYADLGGTNVAYAMEGFGTAVVQVSNWANDVETELDAPFTSDCVRRVAEYARFVWFDQPGTGHSDPLFEETNNTDKYAESTGAVMDAAGIERAVLITWDIGTAPAVMFAASHPERVSGLITIGGSARWLADDGYIGLPEESLTEGVEAMARMWGTKEYGAFIAPSMASDDEACESVARWTRHAASPGTARRVFEMALRLDVRQLLPRVACPVLVLAEQSALAAAPIEQSQYLADHLPNAQLEVLDTWDHLPYQREHREWIHRHFAEFITDQPYAPPAENRVLTTILFLDLVSSTALLAQLGDDRWRRTLDHLERLFVENVALFGGRVVKTTGDGFLATFDSPARSIQCASAIRSNLKRDIHVDVRIGIHTGEVELRGTDIGGLAVHIAARIMGIGPPGEIVTSSTVRDLATGSGLKFAELGDFELRGVPGNQKLFTVTD